MPSQPPIHFVPAAISFGIKRLGHGADHTPPCGVKAKNVWNNSSIPQYTFMVLTVNTSLFTTLMTSSILSPPRVACDSCHQNTGMAYIITVFVYNDKVNGLR
jgi:hypothetical protein